MDKTVASSSKRGFDDMMDVAPGIDPQQHLQHMTTLKYLTTEQGEQWRDENQFPWVSKRSRVNLESYFLI